ncbi:MAG TPA: riboflavin biosynthesis protein RibF [bacterium]|nr:riboflavin biosynthesis protein RibF [bacterium]HQP99550.1 riboflavin biosynthesis protein RibF [bacterium]
MREVDHLDGIQLNPGDNVSVALGVFDGVHRAHQALVLECVRSAREIGGVAAVFTFRNHPAEVLLPNENLSLLTPHSVKREILAELGVDLLVAPPFDRALAEIAPKEFVESILGQRLMARRIYAGFNFRFGKGGRGDAAMLQSYQGRLFERVHIVPMMKYDGLPLSSTRIREAVQAGDLDAVEAMLGRRYRLAGRVVTGDARGRILGFPTANLDIGKQTLPREGIYGARVFFQSTASKGVKGLLYIGSAPSFRQGPEPAPVRVEVFLMDWEGDLYNRDLFVEILCPIREDRFFENPSDLVRQIKKDRDFFLAWLEKNPA